MKRLINLEVKNVLKSIKGNTSLKNIHIINAMLSLAVVSVITKYILIENILSQYSIMSQMVILTLGSAVIICTNIAIWLLTIIIYQKERYIQDVIKYGYFEDYNCN